MQLHFTKTINVAEGGDFCGEQVVVPGHSCGRNMWLGMCK